MDWEKYFPYPNTYEGQKDAIQRLLSITQEGGFLTMEGACGMGKTITALTAATTQIKNPDTAFQRAVVATSVKNQLQQFVEEVREINRNGSREVNPLRGIVLVGKSDLHPYLREDKLNELESGDTLSDLRDRAAKLIKRDSDIPLNTSTSVEERTFQDNAWHDVERAKTVKQRVQRLVETTTQYADENREETVQFQNTLSTGGAETPYPEELPRVEQVADIDRGELPEQLCGPFDPFFVGYYAQEGDSPLGFSDSPHSVITKEELLQEPLKQGISPHLTMSALAERADILIANYNHVFDPQTRRLTKNKMGVLDETTLLIVDEAHGLESRARDLFSSGIGQQTLRTARNDVRGAIQYCLAGEIISTSERNPDVPLAGQLNPQEEYRVSIAQKILREHNLRPVHLWVAQELLSWIDDGFIENTAQDHLREQYDDWEVRLFANNLPSTSDEQISLESPTNDDGENVESDVLTAQLRDRLDGLCSELNEQLETIKRVEGSISAKRATLFDYQEATSEGEGDWVKLSAEAIIEHLSILGYVVGEVWRLTGHERELKFSYVAGVLDRWVAAGHTRYFRNLELSYSPNDDAGSWTSWSDIYNASLELHNCIPADDLAEKIEELGGGVFMSATLEPHSVFREVTGLDILESEKGIPIETATYEMRFPKENRASFIGPLEPYTFKNRGVPTTDVEEMQSTRQDYADVLRGIAGTHGNILIGMPSYNEAEWLFDFLEGEEISKDVLLDTPSTYEETQELLEEFWKDDENRRILISSQRGTVTEGVDYAGEQLHTAIVVGVPLADTSDPKMEAIRESYGERFGSSKSFDYAVAIPAVRKARQTFGRVIRGETDVGVRILLDKRYTERHYQSVHEYLSEQERKEFDVVSQPVESTTLFWDTCSSP